MESDVRLHCAGAGHNSVDQDSFFAVQRRKVRCSDWKTMTARQKSAVVGVGYRTAEVLIAGISRSVC